MRKHVKRAGQLAACFFIMELLQTQQECTRVPRVPVSSLFFHGLSCCGSTLILSLEETLSRLLPDLHVCLCTALEYDALENHVINTLYMNLILMLPDVQLSHQPL